MEETSTSALHDRRRRSDQCEVEKDATKFSELIGGDGGITLNSGRHSGLLGRNATRKTMLCRQMAMHETDRIPKNYHILHTEQEIEGDDMSASQCILNSDVERTQLLQEEVTSLALQRESKLHNATESSKGRVNEGIHKDQNSQRLAEIYKRLECIDAENAESGAASILAAWLEMVLGKRHFLGKWPCVQSMEFPRTARYYMSSKKLRAMTCQPYSVFSTLKLREHRCCKKKLLFSTYRISELDNATENNNGMVNEGIDKDQISHRLPEIYKRLKFIDADAVESRAVSVLLVDCSGTTNTILQIAGGYLVAVESRRTRIEYIENEPVIIVESDNDVKWMVAGDRVLITFAGGTNRCNSIRQHLENVIQVNDDVNAINDHIDEYIRENNLAVGSKGAKMFVVGDDSKGKCFAFRAGDEGLHAVNDNYATNGSGGYYARHKLRKLGHTKNGDLLDYDKSVENIYKAMLESIVNDQSSGGSITVLEISAHGFGKIRNPIGNHGIDLALHFEMNFCPETELFIFTESSYDIMNYWYLAKYFKSLGYPVSQEPTSFGIVAHSWKLFCVSFETREDSFGIFSCGEKCATTGFRRLSYGRGSGRNRVDCDLYITVAHKQLLDYGKIHGILQSLPKRGRENS